FDMQQVHPLPKLPIQDAYYSRQVSYYTFCDVDAKGHSPEFFTWTEEMCGRGSTEVASVLLHFLSNQEFDSGIKRIRLFADGCCGQNKNSHVVHALIHWLEKDAPRHIFDVELIFPVRGHSFLPADTVFGRVEKELKKLETITNPKEYDNVYSRLGKVNRSEERRVGKECRTEGRAE